nr:glycerophosphodiester phosphodiesterase [uncultured Cetobacterium sp.]
MRILGHRGASGSAPENTLAAFKMAFEMGVDGLEFDVQQTKDGELVVFHDWTLERTSNGKGNLKDFTLAELKKLDAGSWFSEKFKGEKIPTLKEVMDIIPEDKFINIELKEENSVENRGTEKTLVNFLKDYKHIDIVVSSFSHNLLKNIKELDSTIKIGVLLESNLIDVNRYLDSMEFEIFSYHPGKSFLNKEQVKKVKSSGKMVNVWTVNFIEDGEKVRDMGVDSIITNYPERFIK